MAENNKNNDWLIILTVLVILSTICSIGYGISLTNKINASKPDLSGINAKLITLANNDALLANKVSALTVTTPAENEEATLTENKGFTLTQREFENNAVEAEALRLATEFVNSRDFEKLAFNVLVDYNESIESYKDITQIKFVDTEIDCSHSDCEVTFESAKVYYFIDGDEEETEKALLEDFTVVVNDVNFDDEFIDAEEDGLLNPLIISKVY